MNKEEYKKEIVRMWDSLRSEELKGEESCRGVECKECALYYSSCEGSDSFVILLTHNVLESCDIVEDDD